jgi:hypothetical protein
MNSKQESPPSFTSSALPLRMIISITTNIRGMHEAVNILFIQTRSILPKGFSLRHMVPRMTFPKFDGTDQCIWKDKCQDYFPCLKFLLECGQL